MTKQGIIGSLAPFIPVLIGIALKFSLFDHPANDIVTHFKTNYVDTIWIDFIVTALVAGIAWFLTRRRIDEPAVIILIVFPIVAFVICVVLKLGLTKAGVVNDYLTLYLPALIGGLCVAAAGNALAKWQ